MQPRALTSRIARSTLFILMAVAVLGFATTYWAWGSATDTIDEYLQDTTAQKTEILERFLDERIVSYEGILRASSGLNNANSGTITREQWKLFVDSLEIADTFPGIESVGYVESFSADQLQAHESRVRATGLSDYSVKSDMPTEYYSVALYIEPQTATSPIGYNMRSEPIRAQTINNAFETGEISSSHILTLKSTPGKKILIVYPLDETQAGINHYTYLAVSIEKLFELGKKNESLQSVEFGVTEGEDLANQDYFYKTDNFDSGDNEIAQTVVNIHDKKWLIRFYPDKTTDDYKAARAQPLIVAILGIVGTVTFTILLGLTLKNRLHHVHKIKESELQASRDELLSLASHQLRTPATSVKHYVGMLLEGYAGKVDKKQRELLSRAYRANERQLEIVSQILHVSRIESGRLELAGETVDISKIARNVIREYRKIARSKHQKIFVEIEKGLPIIIGDVSYLAIVIENLVSNASKYTPEKGSISLQVLREAENVLIEVSDTGVGIDKDDLEQLFKKFSRIHNHLSISAGGSGIGLYLSKLIVELHGGSIEAVSSKDTGTTFRVRLPLNHQ